MHIFRKFQAAVSVIATGSLLLAGGCSSKGHGTSWEVAETTDPMSDVSYASAVTILNGSNADLELKVVCGQAGKAAYQFRAFDKSGEPVEFRQLPYFTTMTRRMIELRVDQKKPQMIVDSSNAFSNQVLASSFESEKLVAATKIAARAYLANGTETFEFDQSSDEFQNVVRGCQKEKMVQPSSSPTPELAAAMSTEPLLPVNEKQKANENCWTPPSGPNIDDDPDRPISADEIKEIEGATGREYVAGDMVWGRAEDRCPA